MSRITRCRGFTLVELAIVIVVISLLLGGLLVPLSSQIENTQRRETQHRLELAQEALLGYALVNGRLPCPDKSPDKTAPDGPGAANDGQQDVNESTGQCVVVEGQLPWVDLAVAGQDSWGRPIRYRVDTRFADAIDGTGCGSTTAGVSFSLCSKGNISVIDEAGGGNLAVGIPALLLSHAKNGSQAESANETENTDNDTVFVNRVYTANADPSTNPQGVFDDIVVWITPHILFNRMVTAGRLP